jgi:hypothetical protein
MLHAVPVAPFISPTDGRMTLCTHFPHLVVRLLELTRLFERVALGGMCRRITDFSPAGSDIGDGLDRIFGAVPARSTVATP